MYEIEQLKPLITELKKREDIPAVYLFGSVAKKTTNKFSDVDICVIPKKETQDLELIVDISVRYPSNYDIINFYRLPIQIRHKVFKEGISLFEHDSKKVSSIIYKTIHEYLEVKPGLERMYNAVLQGGRKHG